MRPEGRLRDQSCYGALADDAGDEGDPDEIAALADDAGDETTFDADGTEGSDAGEDAGVTATGAEEIVAVGGGDGASLGVVLLQPASIITSVGRRNVKAVRIDGLEAMGGKLVRDCAAIREQQRRTPTRFRATSCRRPTPRWNGAADVTRAAWQRVADRVGLAVPGDSDRDAR